MIPFLIKLEENDKRVIIAVLIILFLVFILIGYVGLGIEKVMKRQAKSIDTAMTDLVSTGVVDTPRYFRRIAAKKNARIFYKEARLPIMFVLASAIFMFVYLYTIHDFDMTFLWDYKDKGFTTLFFIFDWPNTPHAIFYGMNLPSGWPPLLSSPHISVEAWPSYVFVPFFTVGAIWLIIDIQALISRTWRLLHMSVDVFRKNLETVVPGSEFHRTKK